MDRRVRLAAWLLALVAIAAACGGSSEPDDAAGAGGTAAPPATAPGSTGTSVPTTPPPASSSTAVSVPEPQPPFAVGKATLTFADPSRQTEANNGVPATDGRRLPVAIYYPAPGVADGVPRTNTSILRHKTWPLLVFVHGTSMTGERYEALTAAMASAGAIVVSPTFPGTSADAPGGPNPALYEGQPADVSFVITTMLELAELPDQPLSGRIDASAIGVFGQSTGGDVALAMTHACCRDERVRAVAALAGTQYLRPGVPNFPIDGYFAEPTVPMLLIHGDADQITPYGDSGLAYEQAPSPKFRATMVGADHLQPSGAAGPHPSFDAAVAMLRAFFEAYAVGPAPPTEAEVDAIVAAGTVPGVSVLDAAP